MATWSGAGIPAVAVWADAGALGGLQPCLCSPQELGSPGPCGVLSLAQEADGSGYRERPTCLAWKVVEWVTLGAAWSCGLPCGPVSFGGYTPAQHPCRQPLESQKVFPGLVFSGVLFLSNLCVSPGIVL